MSWKRFSMRKTFCGLPNTTSVQRRTLLQFRFKSFALSWRWRQGHMIRLWPWSTIRALTAALECERGKMKDLLWRCEMRETIALKAMRDLSAANTGIRRLK